MTFGQYTRKFDKQGRKYFYNGYRIASVKNKFDHWHGIEYFVSDHAMAIIKQLRHKNNLYGERIEYDARYYMPLVVDKFGGF